MKLNLEPSEVREAVAKATKDLVAWSKTGEPESVVIHKNGSATVSFPDDPFEGNDFEGSPGGSE